VRRNRCHHHDDGDNHGFKHRDVNRNHHKARGCEHGHNHGINVWIVFGCHIYRINVRVNFDGFNVRHVIGRHYDGDSLDRNNFWIVFGCHIYRFNVRVNFDGINVRHVFGCHIYRINVRVNFDGINVRHVIRRHFFGINVGFNLDWDYHGLDEQLRDHVFAWQHQIHMRRAL
jgi:hypothetical protein